ncbi:putative vacuolar protein sorting-associated protein 13A isoform A [Senna tora]|uniref:Putative vacuolar protein sorting-associated protein 13A isoform A n=1 Tax=Senna tora TaxID=362788 RepID=A0A834TUX1_9FABA|nr:putative vacuolar protein sorting-associated protein 13A isoform A [Senna tora]
MGCTSTYVHLCMACSAQVFTWIIDSAANRHTNGSSKGLSKYSSCSNGENVQIANGSLSSVCGTGSMTCTTNLTLSHGGELAMADCVMACMYWILFETQVKHALELSIGRMKVGQVNKTVEIRGLEFYSSIFHETADLIALDNVGNSNTQHNVRLEGQSYKSILAPCDVTFMLSANRSEKLDDNAPQYSVNAELTGLVISLDEAQIRQIFFVWDYMCTCRLRERYGRYRPWHSPLQRKLEGWPLLWWHYAQESVLSDVRKKLKKTSWRYLGERLSYRRKYINLYKTKLDFLRQEQPVDEDVLQELEQMEKESDLDDILNYRSAAEHEMQEFFSRSSKPEMGMTGIDIPVEKTYNDEQNLGKPRGWLNWLSRGMLGAGGTDDSSQFSGVVSDDVIKDIYEATEFHPSVSSNVDVTQKHELCLCSMKFVIHQISATLHNKFDEGTTEIILDAGIIESKLHKEHGTFSFKVKSVEMVHPHKKKVILRTRGPIVENERLDFVDHSCSIQVHFSSDHDVELSVKGKLQQLEVMFDEQVLSTLIEFYDVCASFKFQNERVLSSLNRIENSNTRLKLKMESFFASHKKVVWDISILDVVINIAWRNMEFDFCNLVLKSRSICFMSLNDLESLISNVGDDTYFMNSISTSGPCLGVTVQDLYQYFEVKLNDFQVTLMNSDQSQKVSMFEQFTASIFLSSCVIPDESILKQLEAFAIIELLKVHFSPSIYGAILELVTHMGSLHSRDKSEIDSVVPYTYGVSVVSKLHSVVLDVDLANDGDNSSALIVSLQEMNIRYVASEFEELFVWMKSLMISAYKLKDEKDSCKILTASTLSSCTAIDEDCISGTSNESDQYSGVAIMANSCLAIHYESSRTEICRKCTVCLNNADIHCYPYLVGLLIGFFDRLATYGTKFENSSDSSDGNNTDISKAIGSLGLQKFGFSNYIKPGSPESECIPLDHFPFVTIHNSGSLCNLESALLYAIPDWRKHFILTDRKITNPKINVRRRSKFCHVDFSVELRLCGLKVDFHDSSSIVGTITLPTSKSSLFFCKDSMDILSSLEGLVLTSSWWTRNLHDYLWGPSSANLSPILNVRVRKSQSISSTSKLEVSIAIQHVYCMLPPEYLSIIIGYFSLSDWSGNSTDQILSQEQSYMDSENDKSITYKFEILDSNLIMPIENKEHQFLKVEMEQLYCSYIHNCYSDNEIKDIPPESLVPIDKLAKICHCLNVFGRNLFLSYILFKNDIFSFSTTEQNTEYVTTALIAPISADVWVRIPLGNELNGKNSYPATCFMSNIRSCQIIAEDSYISDGCAALLDVIDQFSSVGDQSGYFKSDVPQFLHLKRSSKEIVTVSSMSSTMIYTEVNCRTQSLLINFCHTEEDSVELISKADVQFNCSASLINDSLVGLNLGFSSLELYSLHDSLVLAKCTSTCSSALVLDVSLRKSIEGENEVHICLPSLNIWLHISEWIEVVNFLNQFCILHSEGTSAHFASEEIKDTVFLNLKSNMVGVAVHIPVLFSEEPCHELQLAEHLMFKPSSVSGDIADGRNSKFLSVSFHMNHFELLVSSSGIQLESKIDKLSSTVVIAENRRCTSWPLFEIIQVNIKVAHCTNLTNTEELKLDILCDHSDVWLSHPVFYFCSAVKFNDPEAGSSQFSSFGISFKFQLRKVSFLLTDGRWSCTGPQLEILVKNILLLANLTGKHIECSVTGDFLANYNNIEKVSWEPFIEPWKFQLILIRKPEISVLLNSSVTTDILLNSEGQLNINITEPLVECVSRITEMVMDAWHLMGIQDHSKGNKTTHSPSADNTRARRCAGAAPYILQNLTSVPLFCHVYHRPVNPDEFDDSIEKDKIYVQPGSATPIYMDKNTEDQLTRYRPSCSSRSLNEQKSNVFAHHFISIQLDGTSVPSAPMSMDLVGVTCFEVNFSKGCSENNEDNTTDTASSFVVPVVFDVSVLHYSKLIRIYSTVVLSNATSIPLELRFDIPLGVSPKILDPVLPRQQLPLPLHLAEAGSLRWRPIGNSYLWSEAHNLSKLLSLDNKLGNIKSFVCYPSHPSSCAFRCCISVRNISLASSGSFKKNGSVDETKNYFVHLIILNAPLVVNNYIPKEILLTSDSGGVNHTLTISEGETSVYHIDPSHDLGLEICIGGFKPSYFKFPRLESFCTMAKFSETKYSLSEALTFESSNPYGPMYVTVEKVMDAYSGTREVIIFVPFLLYNCVGFPLCITKATGEIKEQGIVIPSYYEIGENEALAGKKDGLSLVSSSQDLHAEVPPNPRCSLRNQIISTREKVNPLECTLTIPFSLENCHENMRRQVSLNFSTSQNSCSSSLKSRLSSRVPPISKDLGSDNNDLEKVGPCMYSPNPISSLEDVLVKVSRCWPGYVMEKLPHSLWSSPFSLLPPNGSSNIILPQSTANAAFVLAVTSTSIAEPYTGKINAITFQPSDYLIACGFVMMLQTRSLRLYRYSV